MTRKKCSATGTMVALYNGVAPTKVPETGEVAEWSKAAVC